MTAGAKTSVYDMFRADPDAYRSSYLYNHFKRGRAGIMKPIDNPALEAWQAGRDAAVEEASTKTDTENKQMGTDRIDAPFKFSLCPATVGHAITVGPTAGAMSVWLRDAVKARPAEPSEESRK